MYVDSAEEAASYLKETKGNILVTTGSKELGVFTEIPDYQERVFARVLAGFCGKILRGWVFRKNLICMQALFPWI